MTGSEASPVVPGERGYPFVAQAGHTQFAPDHVLHFPRVQSRAVVGCHAGRGTVVLQGVEHPLRPGLLYLLPWNHSIRYQPDPKDPFFVFGVHVIPWQRATQPLTYVAAHDEHDPLHGVDWRRACPPGVVAPAPEVVATSETERPALAVLARYAVERFLRGYPSLTEGRALGVLMLSELDARWSIRPQDDPSLPAGLRGLLVWITRNLGQRITLADMATVLECSPSTVTRQFRQFLRCSPLEWVISQRIERAQHLLAAGNDTVATIARDCGFDDAGYFSRMFKARVGASPREWRLYRTI